MCLPSPTWLLRLGRAVGSAAGHRPPRQRSWHLPARTRAYGAPAASPRRFHWPRRALIRRETAKGDSAHQGSWQAANNGTREATGMDIANNCKLKRESVRVVISNIGTWQPGLDVGAASGRRQHQTAAGGDWLGELLLLRRVVRLLGSSLVARPGGGADHRTTRARR